MHHVIQMSLTKVPAIIALTMEIEILTITKEIPNTVQLFKLFNT